MTDDDAKAEGRKLAKLALILFMKKRDERWFYSSKCRACNKRRTSWSGLCDECARKLEEEIARMPS